MTYQNGCLVLPILSPSTGESKRGVLSVTSKRHPYLNLPPSKGEEAGLRRPLLLYKHA